MTTNNAVNVGLSGSTGTGSFVGSNSPTLVTPTLGAALATSLNFGGSSLGNYVQGTFTPALTGSVTNPSSITYSNQSGEYTRIGNVVYWSVNINVSALTIGSASGNLQITGLPFTSSATLTVGSCVLGAVTYSGTQVAPIVPSSSSIINLYQFSSILNIAVISITAISSNTVIEANGFYFTS